jgi:hypothetical protein
MQPKDLTPQDMIDAIGAAFGRGDSTNVHDVPKAQVLAWMESPDLDVRGALYSVIADADLVTRVKPALGFDDCFDFVVSYLEQCMVEDPKSEWADSRYSAGRQLVTWIIHFWESKEIPREKLLEIKGRLAALYTEGDEDTQDALVNAVLEHLFEKQELVAFFEDWKDDRNLAKAYGDALAWIKEAPPGFSERLAAIEQMKRKGH